MSEYVNVKEFIQDKRLIHCANCKLRKDSAGQIVHEIGNATCTVCGINQILEELKDYSCTDKIMTNYEWLVQENKVTDFLYDFYVANSSTRLSKYGLFNKWKIKNKDVENLKEFLDVVSKWLQAEHKEPEKYVNLNDVLKTVAKYDHYVIVDKDSKAGFNCLSQELQKLSTKEIEE